MTYWITGSVVPFDDQNNVVDNLSYATTENPPMDTKLIDTFRQGIELRNIKDFYISFQPKIWGGSFNSLKNGITHQQTIQTYGQAVSFTEFFGDSKFIDLPIFNPVNYIILGNNYPTPIYFNGGPQDEQEAIIETLPIKDRFPDIDIKPSRSVKGNIDQGNCFDGMFNGNSLIEQFVNIKNTKPLKPFLEQGERQIGGIVIEGWSSPLQPKIEPYIEESDNTFNTTDSNFLNAILSLKSYTSENIIKKPNQKSSCAGLTVYSSYQNLGTDSIAFNGRIRGS